MLDDVLRARASAALDRMTPVTLHAITVLGHDRPGIIAETTDRLAGLGLNLEDSTMTLLRGHFAMTLICAGDAADAEIEAGAGAADRRRQPHRRPSARCPPSSRTAGRGDGVGADASTAATGPASCPRVVGEVAAASAATSPT